MSEALEYHRVTNVAAGGTDEDEVRTIETRPSLFKNYGDAERLPLGASIAGPLLQDGAGIVRSQERRDYGGGTIHWRAYSSAGALYPVEAYVANAGGLYSFDALSRALVHIGEDVRSRLGVDASEVVVLTGIHERTGWKYMERGYRHVWWDAGTMLANLLALAAAEGLEPRLYTAFVDADVNDSLGIDGEREYALGRLPLEGGAPSRSRSRGARTRPPPWQRPTRSPPGGVHRKARSRSSTARSLVTRFASAGRAARTPVGRFRARSSTSCCAGRRLRSRRTRRRSCASSSPWLPSTG